MLTKILSKETCKKCKFCCNFKRESLWESPLFSSAQKESLEEKYPQAKFKANGGCSFTIDLDSAYKTEQGEEEAACWFLNAENGCSLANGDKPFDCAIWPFRLMKKENDLVIALTPTCPAVNKIPLDTLKKFVGKNLAAKIFEYGRQNPFIIKEYKDGFPVIIANQDFTE